ncbi:MAG: phage portal protein [Syntrophales bacterium]|jgi:HK97 family phage portal protein|nr:phage portal protein [Syntrophales bacterium]
MKFFDSLFKKRSWANLDAFEGRETSYGIHINETVALGIPAVYACIRVLTEAIASLPLITYERFANGDKDRAKGFSLYHLLHDEPNPLMTSFELRELLVGHLCLRGNAYCYIERDGGEVVALWPLHPDKVTVEVSGRELVYKHQNDGVEKVYPMADILHIRGLSADGIIGFSPLTLLRDTFGYSKAVQEYSSSYFRNDASPGGILTTAQTLGVENQANLRNAWSTGHEGKGKHHRVAILGNDLKWQSIGVSPQDSQLIESQKFSVVEIARIFRIPLNLIMDYERSTYANVQEQNRSFLTHTLQPWLSRIEGAMTKSLLTESEKEKYFIEHLTQGFLRADTKIRYESYKVAIEAGFLTIDEVRQLENMNALPKPEVAP